MTIIQPGILEVLPSYGDWWSWQGSHTLPDGTQKKGLAIRVQPDMWKGYQVLDQGKLLARVQIEHPKKWQIWRDYYTIDFDGQQLRLDTSDTSKDGRARLVDASSQIVAEYRYDTQQQSTALVLRGQQYPLGEGWGDGKRAHRYLNDSAGRAVLRVRLRTMNRTTVQAIDLLQSVPAELAVVAAVFAGLVPYELPSTEEAAAFAYQSLEQALFDLPQILPGCVEFIPVPYKNPTHYLVVKQDMLLATVVLRRTGVWPLGSKYFEFIAGNVAYRTNTSPMFSSNKEYLTDANGTTIAARVTKSNLKEPAMMYAHQNYKIDSEWNAGNFRRLYDNTGAPLFMVEVSQYGVARVHVYQPVAGGLVVASSVLALTNDYSPDTSGGSG